MTTFRVDFRGPLGKAQVLSDGSLKVRAYLARTGVQEYTYSDGRKVREHRPAEEVFSQTSLDSFKGLALTVQHPGTKVDPANWRSVAVGHVGEDVRRDGNLVAASLYIKDADTIRRIQAGELVEISNGYDCKMVPNPGRNDAGEEYDAVQSNIVGNHVALGPANWGRAGRAVRLYLDSADSQVANPASIGFSEPDQSEEPNMADKTKTPVEPVKETPEVKPAPVVEPVKEDPKPAPVVEPAPAPAPEPGTVEPTKEEPAPAPAPAVETPELKTPDNLDSLDARLELVNQARRLVPGFDYKGKTDSQIRREVVEAKGLKTDSKDDGYVAGRFDSLLETLTKQDAADSATGDLRIAGTNPVTKQDAAEVARANMVKANNEAWKTKTKRPGQGK